MDIRRGIPDPGERAIRVFVSSTFRDMVEDRNELMSHAWPALRRLCRGRAVEFVEVDLRWGVTEEQTQRKETLRHCLAEIRRCRPYFIGLLGERYGWVPGPEAYTPALLEEEGWLGGKPAGRSVTELEILHGVLNDPDMAGRSFFYFRDPAYAQARGGDYLPGSAADAERQEKLKQRVKAVCQTKNIPLREGYQDQRDLASLVLADLTAAVEAEYPADRVPDAWEREDRDHEVYAKSRRTEFYVGREAYFDRLDSFVRDGEEGHGLSVLGASGGGKSALLANWAARWRQGHPDDFVFQHYTGSSPMSAGHLALMRRLMVAIIRWCADGGDPGPEEEKIPAQAEEVVKAFPGYLDRLAIRAKGKGVRAVIVLDALNQLEDRERGRLLAWLPHRLPGELRLVVSTLPGDTLDALTPRGWPALTVKPLTKKERVELIARYLKHFSQGLSGARARKIAAVPAASNPLYLKTLLDDLRVTGTHERLDGQIADYLRAADIPTLLTRILARYERDYERDRPGLVGEALGLLWSARRGLAEPELLELMRPDGQERLPAAMWSPLRYALEDGLVDRDGVLAFAHEHLRSAVEAAFVANQDKQDSFRRRLADYFEAQPTTARSCDELPWLLWKTGERDRLRACLLEVDRFLLIRERDRDELMGFWVWLGEERKMGKAYLESFLAWSREQDSQDTADAAHELASFLKKAALHAEAEPLFLRALAFYERNYGEGHPDVAASLNNLAELLQKTNRRAEAERLYRRALAIDEKNLGKDHPDVAVDLNNLAQLLKDTNRLVEAEPLMRRALAIDERSLGEDHPRVATDLNNLAGLLQEPHRLEEAEPLYRRALTIDERSYGKDHPEVATDLNNLAQLLQDTNRSAEAELLFHRALSINERSRGKNHPEVATNLNNLAALLYHTNRIQEAEPLMRRVIEIYQQFTRATGHLHPDLWDVVDNYGTVLEAMGESRKQVVATLRKLAPEFFKK